MRSAQDIRRRLEAWEAERAQLFPQALYGLISLRKIESEVRTALDTGGDPKESSIRQHIDHLRNRPRPDKATAYILDSVIKELRWALGEEEQGALHSPLRRDMCAAIPTAIPVSIPIGTQLARTTTTATSAALDGVR